MIVLPDLELVIFTPPHTASGNVHQAVCGHSELTAWWVLGRWCDGQLQPDHHTMDVAPRWMSHRMALVWRDPVDRAEGLFRHQNWSRETLFEMDRMPWPRFADLLCKGGGATVWELFHWRIADFVGDRRIDRVVRFDRLQDDLSDLIGVQIQLPPAYDDPMEEIDPEMIRDWALPDYELIERLSA